MEHKRSAIPASGVKRYAFWKQALLAGAIAGCGGGGFIAVSHETARLPDNGDACPTLGPTFQVFQGQEVGFGTGRRPLYVARVRSLEGSSLTADVRVPLQAPSTRISSVSYVVTLSGIRTDTGGLGRLANSECRVITSIRDPPSVARVEVPDGGSPSPPPPPPHPQELEAQRFPADSSAEFSRRLAEGLGSAIGSAFAMIDGSRSPAGRADITLGRSENDGFIVSSGGRTVKLMRRAEVQWDVGVPQEASLRIPYLIRGLTIENGRVSADIAVDCDRDMEASGSGLDVRSGPHPSCRGPETPQKKR